MRIKKNSSKKDKLYIKMLIILPWVVGVVLCPVFFIVGNIAGIIVTGLSEVALITWLVAKILDDHEPNNLL